MPRLRGRDEVRRRKQRLETVFAQLDGAELPGELQSHFSRYLCILVSGYAEQSIKELVQHYCRQKSEARIQRYVGGQLKRLQNIDDEKLRQLIQTFDAHWWEALLSKFPDELEAFESVAAVRNSVAHGGDSGITLGTVKQYFEQVSRVLDELCTLFDPRP